MALTAGDKATKNVFLRYEGGYTDAHLVPAEGDGETAPEGRGLLLVAKGDEIRQGHADLYAQAEKYQSKLTEEADAQRAAEEAAEEAAHERALAEQDDATKTAADGSSPAEEPAHDGIVDTSPAPGGPVPADQAAADAAPKKSTRAKS